MIWYRLILRGWISGCLWGPDMRKIAIGGELRIKVIRANPWYVRLLCRFRLILR